MSSLWIWPFELEEKIGEGGMGVVYRARYVKNDRRVAVKLLPADVANETILARFEREVEVLKTLRHPNIVFSFGGVCEDKQRFYAMELVEGGTLEDMLKRRGGQLPWEEVVAYAKQMCAGLAYAHERGVVHRDIKPGNFLISKKGQLKLSDFGLATVVSGSKLTSAGQTMGTLRYMAPEQIRGKPAPSAATDLYALGCLLFQMVTGRTPFDGNSAAELMNKHLKSPPPRVGELNPECPAPLDNLIARLLAKKPEDRPLSALEVAQALEQVGGASIYGADTVALTAPRTSTIITDDSSLAPTRSATAYPGKLLAAGTVALAMLLVVCIWFYRRDARYVEAERLWIAAFESNENVAVRQRAAQALGELAARSSAPLHALKKGLDDPNSQIRRATVDGLKTAGAAARPLLPQLINVAKNDREPAVREAAAEAVKQVNAAGGGSSGFWWLAIGLIVCGGAGGFFFWKKATA